MKDFSHRWPVIGRLAFLAVVAGGIIAQVRAGDSTPPVDSPAEYPGLVVTAASIERVLDRGVLMTELAGNPISKEQILGAIALKCGDRTLNGIDRNKPAGMIVFLPLEARKNADVAVEVGERPEAAEGKDVEEKKGVEKPAEPNENGESPKDDPDKKPDEFDAMMNRIGQKYMETVEPLDNPWKWVIFLPISDFDIALKSLKLTPVSGKPDQFTNTDGDEISLRRIGNYIVCGKDSGRVALCPDPGTLVPPLLDSNDLVVTFRAMPAEVRIRWADAIKLEFATMFLPGKDESPNLYALRRAAGGLVAELLDLAISYVEEVNLALRVDSKQKRIFSELNIVGPENGELAQAAADWSPRHSVTQGLEQDNGPISYKISFWIPERHSKPIGEALRDYARNPDGDPLFRLTLKMLKPLVRSITSLIQRGDFEFFCTCFQTEDEWSPILGLKFPGGREFPKEIQSILNLFFSEDNLVQTNNDAVAGVPIHRVLFDLFPTFFTSIGEFDDRCWLAATPDMIWLHATAPDRKLIPEPFKAAITQTSSKAAKPSETIARDIPFFRMVLHSKYWMLPDNRADNEDEAKPKIEQAELKQAEANSQRKDQEAILVIFREKADGVYAELRPSSAGLKLTIQWDEAFLALCGRNLVKASRAGGND